MADWIKGEWQVATKEICEATWMGRRNGKYFRCAFCGHKFKIGDMWRRIFTNNVPNAGGNPLVCGKCNLPEEKLIEKGTSKEILDRVVSPMGLEIDAETPEEIALSILAEIVMLRRGGDGKRMTRNEKE